MLWQDFCWVLCPNLLWDGQLLLSNARHVAPFLVGPPKTNTDHGSVKPMNYAAMDTSKEAIDHPTQDHIHDHLEHHFIEMPMHVSLMCAHDSQITVIDICSFIAGDLPQHSFAPFQQGQASIQQC